MPKIFGVLGVSQAMIEKLANKSLYKMMVIFE